MVREVGASNLPPREPRHRRRVALAATVVVAIVAVGLVLAVLLVPFAPGAPAANPNSPTEIDLLPSSGTHSTCIVATPGVPRPSLPLHNGTLQANTYGVPAGTTGHAGMCYNAGSGSLFSWANWSKVGGAGGWFSYPQIAYGVANYEGAATTYTNQSPTWVLPQTVTSTVNESLWVMASYDLRAPSASDVDGYDLSFDDFLSEGLPPTFETPPFPFVEIEIFLAHNISYPFHWIHWSTPTVVNGTLRSEPWDVAYWCHGVDNGSNANVSFDFSYGGQATHGLADGTLGVNLSALFAETETLMPGASCWTGSAAQFPGFYLGEEDLGSEDGARGGSSFNYNWTVTSYCLHTRVSSASLSDLACRVEGSGTGLSMGGASGAALSWDTLRGPSSLGSGPLGMVAVVVRDHARRGRPARESHGLDWAARIVEDGRRRTAEVTRVALT